MKTKIITFFLALITSVGTISASTMIDGIWYDLHSNTKIATVTYTPELSSGDYRGSIIIPSSVTYGDITYTVTGISRSAFRYSYSLTSITIPNSVTYIGEGAFGGCTSLTNITIPNSVTSIGNYAFSGCSGLTSITIPNSVTYIGEDAFGGCTSLTNITIPNSVTSIGGSAFSGCTSLTNLTIPNSVTSIGNYAFSGCSGLTSITIPNSVTSIGNYAFSGCSGLTSITIPNNVTSIGYGAFNDCKGLISVTIPNSVTSIEGSAFSGCSGLTSITIPNSVTYIGEDAFGGCTSLTNITIPGSVLVIDYRAFYNCTGLTSIAIEAENPPAMGSRVFEDTNNCPIYVPCGTLETYLSSWSPYSYRIKYPAWEGQGLVNISNAGEVILPTICDTTITAIPYYGYNFVQWSDGVTDNPRTFVPTQDSTFTAEFAPNKYVVSVTCDEERGTIAGENGEFDYLTELTYIAKPNYGYHLERWNITDGEKTIEDTDYENNLLWDYTNKAPSNNPDNGLYYANKVSLDGDYGIKMNSTGYAYFTKSAISGTLKLTFYTRYSGDSSALKVETWEGAAASSTKPSNLTLIATTEEAPARIITTTSIHLTAEQNNIFIEQHTPYEIVLQKIQFIADKYPLTTSDTITIIVVTNTVAQALLEKNTYSIIKNAEHGSILGNSTAEYMDTITIIAKPDNGYHFVQWNDSVIENPRTIVLTQDTSFTAEFAQTFAGQCGDSLYWKFVNDTLKFSGSGDMYHYTVDSVPWSLLIAQIQYIDFSLKMSSISENAFQNMTNLRKINLSSEIKTIGENAFVNCTSVKNLTIPNSVTTLGANAFYGCSSIDTLVLGTGITTITNQFRGCSKLRYLQMSQNMESIGYGSFYDARQLIFIVCYAKLPPLIYPDEEGKQRSFYNTNALALVPCDNYGAYFYDALWSTFNLKCLSSESSVAVDGQVTVIPGDADATFTWPTDRAAETYNLEITKDSMVFCTLTFNSQGQLLGIAFAPSANGVAPHAPQAVLTTSGMTFQVTGLDYASRYRFSFETKNAATQTLFAYTGSFHTNGTTAPEGFENIDAGEKVQKILLDGTIYILRGDRVYTLQGQEVR